MSCFMGSVQTDRPFCFFGNRDKGLEIWDQGLGTYVAVKNLIVGSRDETAPTRGIDAGVSLRADISPVRMIPWK
jgi:hypothetical protein